VYAQRAETKLQKHYICIYLPRVIGVRYCVRAADCSSRAGSSHGTLAIRSCRLPQQRADDWEVAHFGNLNRNGAGDQDGDGQTDSQEFLSGTDPTNSGSILRVLTITRLRGSGSTTVVWSAVAGRSYVVQYKDSLDAPWANASGVLAADSASMSFTQSSSSPQRFYRVVAVQ